MSYPSVPQRGRSPPQPPLSYNIATEERNIAGIYKTPPVFEEGDNYGHWKLELQLWQEFTSLPTKKQGTALLLELKPGKMKDAVRSLGKEVLVAENAIAEILFHLDQKYWMECTVQSSYQAYNEFESFSRPDSMSLLLYGAEFNRLMGNLKRHNILLPTAVLAYRFLNGANLSPESVDLLLPSVKEITFSVTNDMLTAISKIMSDRRKAAQVKVEQERARPEYDYDYSYEGPYNSRGGYSSSARWTDPQGHHYFGNLRLD